MSETVSEALRSLYVGHRQQLYTYAVSITRNRESAEDAIQRAFQQLMRRTCLPEQIRPYVFRCVRNAALDDLRRRRVRSASLFEDETAADPRTDDGARDRLLAGEIEQALRQVSDDEREVIVLRIYNGLAFQEIAEVRGAPLATVTSWYRRGLIKLREALQKEIR